MKKITDILTEELTKCFSEAGFQSDKIRATVSNRPDLCQYQCNGAMALAKEMKMAPIKIAEAVVEKLASSEIVTDVAAVIPGFINFNLKDEYIMEYLGKMAEDDRFGIEKDANPKKIVIDYGGPNVAKPLHVGHLRSAIIGESVKRILRYMGNDVTGDIHLGDWGLQMGLIITELKKRQPELCYFDESFDGEYPEEAPFTISELEEIYPAASAKSKADEAYKAEAMQATFKLQKGDRGYMALWRHIMNVSVTDLKKNYANLNVSFELWKGESDVEDDIKPMVDKMAADGFAYESDGAIVVDVAKEDDTKEVPPCMILKSDGAALYTTTDLATLLQRRENINPDRVVYVVDKRQEMHFIQVFRCAKKTGIMDDSTSLEFLGFGTMNGADGKPFKTRDGGVMRLELLLNDINEKMYEKITENHEMDEKEAREISKIVGLAAVKYGDLSNQASKDYIFDIDKFTSFEGNTGPYILYTIVRIKSILKKYVDDGGKLEGLSIGTAKNDTERNLMLELLKLHAMAETAYAELAPHKICAYMYDVANVFNSFYHDNRILAEENEDRKKNLIKLLVLTRDILLTCIDLLGFGAPEHM